MLSGLDGGTPIKLFLNAACLEFQSKEKSCRGRKWRSAVVCPAGRLQSDSGESRSSHQSHSHHRTRYERRRQESTEFELTGGGGAAERTRRRTRRRGRQHRIAVARVGEHESFSRKPLVIRPSLPLSPFLDFDSDSSDLCMSSTQSFGAGKEQIEDYVLRYYFRCPLPIQS